MSDDVEGGAGIPMQWERLERSTDEAVLALVRWRRRAGEAEAEVERLRRSLEELAVEGHQPTDLSREVRRLKAENAALSSRMLQARKRLAGLMQRLSALETES